MPLFHPSGGLAYHLRAWRYRHTLWHPFHAEVRRWLADWQPQASHLVLVGPSGGYALEGAFLARFSRITVLEPDPVARALLQRGFPWTSFQFESHADLVQADGFQRLAARYPHAAFLFCNLLGQPLLGQGRGQGRQTWLSGLQPALTGRDWASWHDLVSTERMPDQGEPFGLAQAEPLDTLLGRVWQGGELAIHDHEMSGLAPGLPRQYALWPLFPGRFHLIEWFASG